MPDLSTKYLGLSLKNPIIVGASALTADLASIVQIEKAGAGALVTKSLFEEEIQFEHFMFDEDMDKGNYRNPEMITIRPKLDFGGPAEHIMWVRKAKEAVGIPVIASLNAVNRKTWLNYARQLAATGVDALECNLFASPRHMEKHGAEIEKEQMDLVRELRSAVSIPVSVKLSFFYTNPCQVVHQMDQAGVNGFVLFNRLFEPDIDIQTEKYLHPFNFSHGTDYRLPLRYAGLLEGNVKADLCCSSGIFTGEDIIKMLLAGASAIQTVSAMHEHGFGHIKKMLEDIQKWMERKGHRTIESFRGKLSRRHCNAPWAYTHAQYVKLLMNPNKIIENYPVV